MVHNEHFPDINISYNVYEIGIKEIGEMGVSDKPKWAQCDAENIYYHNKDSVSGNPYLHNIS